MSHTNMILGGNWRQGEWPDHIEVSHRWHGYNSEPRRYVPERTCRIRDTGHEYEDSVRCSECMATFERPWQPFVYCPNCGAKAVEE